jgi:hypothetical protein
MKTFYALSFIIVFAFGFSPTISGQEKLKDILPLKDGKVTYTNVILVDSISKEEIYKRAKQWLAQNFEYTKNDDNDLLISRGYIQYGMFKFWHTIIIKIKDGKYKYEITDFTFSDGNVDQNIEGNYISLTKKSDFKYIDDHVTKIIISLEQAIKTDTSKEDNW